MAGRGAPPKLNRRRAAAPARGDWRPAAGVGWQYGKAPAPPDGLTEASQDAWRTWFASWVGAHWVPGDVPQLRIVIRLFDEVQRGKYTRAAELRMWADCYGITPKGQQDRRWQPPQADAHTPPRRRRGPADKYAGLRVIGDADANPTTEETNP